MKVAISNQAKGKSVQRLAISRLIIRQCEVDFQSLESLEVNCFNSRLPQKQTKKKLDFWFIFGFQQRAANCIEALRSLSSPLVII